MKLLERADVLKGAEDNIGLDLFLNYLDRVVETVYIELSEVTGYLLVLLGLVDFAILVNDPKSAPAKLGVEVRARLAKLGEELVVELADLVVALLNEVLKDYHA